MINLRNVIRVGYGPMRDGTGRWEAALTHPTAMRFILGHGVDGPAACAAFVAAYNTDLGSSRTAEDFEFYRQVKVEALVYMVAEGIECVANPGSRPPISVVAATQEEAEQLFITTWNTEMATDFEPVEFSFAPAVRRLTAPTSEQG